MYYTIVNFNSYSDRKGVVGWCDDTGLTSSAGASY